MIMGRPEKTLSIGQKVHKSRAKRQQARSDISYMQSEGWRFVDKAKDCFELRNVVPQERFMVLNIRNGTRWDILKRIITRELLESILNTHAPETWCLQQGRYFTPTFQHIYKMLAIAVRIQGIHNTPSLHKHNTRPLEKAIKSSREHFDIRHPDSTSPNSKVIERLLTHFLISADHYELLSRNFQSVVRILGECVAGDEKLLHFTGNSGHIMLVRAKPARIGLWFYQLVGCMANGQPFELHIMMMRVDKSRDERAVVDEVVQRWKKVIDDFGLPCILVFDKYYFSKGSLGVLLGEQQQRIEDAPTLFIGSTRKSSMQAVCSAFKGKVTKPGDWEGLYHAGRNLIMVEYYDFDRNINQKTVLSNAFIHRKMKPASAAVPVYDEYKAAFAFCDKFNKALYQRCWPHKQGGNSMLGDVGHQHNFALSSTLQNVFNAYCEIHSVPPNSVDFYTHCLALADEIYAFACTLTD